jgi:putative spermidine/putrescine transport system permease protein
VAGIASTVTAPAARPQDKVIIRTKKQRDWVKWGLGAYYVLFIAFLYGPMIVMAILSFQGYYGGVTFPFKGPISLLWWKSLIYDTVGGSPTHASEIHTAAINSLKLSVVAGILVALLAFTTSMAFRRRWRFKSDGAGFYLLMLALMTPGFLLAVGTQLLWAYLGLDTSIWKTALGASVSWGIPFGFLVMLAVWNRYDARVEEAARDLGAGKGRTFREVTLPLVWTGIFGCFLFGGITFTSAVRPDLYALGTATTMFSLLVIGIVLFVASVRLRFRGQPVHKVEEEFGVATSLRTRQAGPESTPPAATPPEQ